MAAILVRARWVLLLVGRAARALPRPTAGEPGHDLSRGRAPARSRCFQRARAASDARSPAARIHQRDRPAGRAVHGRHQDASARRRPALEPAAAPRDHVVGHHDPRCRHGRGGCCSTSTGGSRWCWVRCWPRPIRCSPPTCSSRSPQDRDSLRFGLTGEGGLNDGTAFPFVLSRPRVDRAPRNRFRRWRWIAVDLVWGTVGGLGIGFSLGTGWRSVCALCAHGAAMRSSSTSSCCSV